MATSLETCLIVFFFTPFISLIVKQLKSISHFLACGKLRGKNRKRKFCFCYWIESLAKLIMSPRVRGTKPQIKRWRALTNVSIFLQVMLMHRIFFVMHLLVCICDYSDIQVYSNKNTIAFKLSVCVCDLPFSSLCIFHCRTTLGSASD